MGLSTPMPIVLLGQIGEAIADDRCWVNKTHAPGRFNSIDFSANRIIVTARNPFDSLISFTTFLQCFSHSKQIENKLEEEDPEWFETWIKALVVSFKMF